MVIKLLKFNYIRYLKQEENEENEEDQAKWEYLEHNGVIVPGYYKKHNVKPLY